MDHKHFQKLVWEHYRAQGRLLPWRATQDSYAVAVSEIMLQQTQADRVVPKYEEFLRVFPTWQALAEAEQAAVIQQWQGLGYNRRALALKRMAEAVVSEHGGRLPASFSELVALPGIGPYTAGAILAFAFNQGVPVIETNIRRVYLHHFFGDQADVSDKDLLPVIEATLDQGNPREWYWALMDYGSWLAKQLPNPNRRSRHYAKQSKFEGSNRQVRGGILRVLSTQPTATTEELAATLDQPLERVQATAGGLLQEGFLVGEGDTLRLA